MFGNRPEDLTIKLFRLVDFTPVLKLAREREGLFRADLCLGIACSALSERSIAFMASVLVHAS